MPSRRTIRQIAEMAEIVRYLVQREVVVEVGYRKGAHVGKLTQIRFSRDEATGRPTKRIIDCLDNGTLTHYDKKYEVDFVAVIIDGHRTEVRDKT